MAQDLSDIIVSEVMQRSVITVKETDTIQHASMLMRENSIKGLVVTSGAKVSGILTCSDIVSKVVAENKSPRETKVSDIMSPKIIVALETDTIEDISQQMYANDIGRIPIVDSESCLVGIVTKTDMLRVYPGVLEIFFEQEKNETGVCEPERTSEDARCEECGNYSLDLVEIDGRWLCRECAEELGKENLLKR